MTLPTNNKVSHGGPGRAKSQAQARYDRKECTEHENDVK